jgi:hypothetical protein
MPCADKGKVEVLPEINQSNSAITARRKTRLVVKRGSTRIRGSPGLVEGIEREKWRGCGAKIEYVPVPVLQVQELRTLNAAVLRRDCSVPITYLDGVHPQQ